MVLQLLRSSCRGPTSASKPEEAAVAATTGLCLVPTRELALQVQKSILDVTKCLPSDTNASQQSTGNRISVVACYGGVDKKAQRDALIEAGKDRRPLIVTATMGRLLDLLTMETSISLAAQKGSDFAAHVLGLAFADGEYGLSVNKAQAVIYLVAESFE